MKRLFITLAILGICFTTHAQTYSGRVTDSKGAPLEFVSVVLRSAKNAPVAFVQTNEKGQFSISVPSGKNAERISFNILGYGDRSIPVTEFDGKQPVILSETEYSLKEVKVKPDKIRQTGDTITYNVLAFKQKQDRSIADVIAKMPGLEVKQNGQISFQGKPVSKVYIEGMDLLGGKYSLASGNISADKVKNVQVLQNHQSVKALKNIRFSEQAALNIVLRDDAKNVWQWVADIAMGSSLQDKAAWLRDARAITMFFARKMQSITMYKTNNTGRDIEHEIADLTRKSTTLPMENALIANINLPAPSLKQNRYMRNDTHLFATNWLLKTSKNNDLRLQIHGLIDKTNQERTSQTIYIDVADSAMTEVQEAISKRNEWKLEASYKVNHDKVYLKNNLQAYIDFNSSHGTSFLNGRNIIRNISPRRRYIANDLEYIQTMKNDKTFSLNSQLLYSHLPGRLLLYNSEREKLDINSFQWNANLSFRHKIAGFYMTYRFGADLAQRELLVENPKAIRKERYGEKKIHFMPSMSYKTNALSFSASVKTSLMLREINGRKKNNITLEPGVYLDYKLTGNTNTTLTYGCSLAPNALSLISESPIYTNYISIVQGNGQLTNMLVQTVRNSWNYRNAVRGFFASLTAAMNLLNNVTLFESSWDDGFYSRRATNKLSNNNSWNVSGRMGKSIGWGKMSLSVNGLYRASNYKLLIGRQVHAARLQTVALGTEISYHPTDILSFEEISSMNQNKQQVFNTVSVEKLRYFNHKLSIFLMPGKWQIEWVNELYHGNDKSIGTSLFSDLSISYRQKTYELSLLFTNIFGTKEFQKRILSDHSQTYFVNPLRPRELMLKASFSL